MDRLKEDEIAWKNYRHFSDAYKRIRIAYIEAARKRPEEFEKRLNNFICKVKENKMITGFGGIENIIEIVRIFMKECPYSLMEAMEHH